MATVTHKVVWGDTLWALAKKHGTTVDSIAALNNISNPDRIYVGQVLTIKGGSSSGGSATPPPSSNSVNITAFGLQSNTDNLIFAVWSWSKDKTKDYEVEWSYYTDNGLWFTGNKSNTEEKESTYNAPTNAIKVRCRVKPVSTTYTSGDTEKSHWQGSWCSYKEYSMSDNPPQVPQVPTVTIEQYTMKMRNDNLNINAWEIEYEVVQNDSTVFNSGIAYIKTGAASYQVNINPGHTYKVRARGRRGQIHGDWTDYSASTTTIPNSPDTIREVKAISDTAVQLIWDPISSAKTYSIQHAEDKLYFEGSNGVTTIDNIETTTYTITGLTKGKRYYFRIRATNESGNSDWSSVKSIAIGTKPEAPSTWSDKTVAIIGEKVLLGWKHNSVDGSEQMRSEIQFEVNGVVDTHQIGMDINGKPIDYFELPTFMFTDGTKVYWRVRTQGVTPEFSEWSIKRVIDMHAPPSLMLNVVNDAGGNTDWILGFPFYIKAVPGPVSQKPITYAVSIKSKEAYTTSTAFGEVHIKAGDEIFSGVYNSQENLNLELNAGNIDLENNISYEVHCMVTMDTGLDAEARKTFGVRWHDIYISPNAELIIDKNKLSAGIRPFCERYENVYRIVEERNGKYVETSTELTIGYQNGISVDGAVTNTKKQVYRADNGTLFCITYDERLVEVKDVIMSVYRRTYDGKFIEIATGLNGSDNTFVTDPHPSLDYARYRVVATDKNTGSVSYTDLSSQPINETGIIIQWDENWSDFNVDGNSIEDVQYANGSMIKLPYNIDISESNSPEAAAVNYIGREHPVSYYGTQLGVSSTWNAIIEKDNVELLYAIRRLSMYMGDVYVREPSGVGYWANLRISYNKTHDALTIPITMDLVRVEGGV